MKEFTKKYIKLLIPSFIVIICLLLVYLIKGIYPFGSKTISVADLAQSYVPVYTYLWDALKGNTGFLFNYNLGVGVNMYGSIVLNALYSPISWLICLTTRDNILNFFSILLMIRLSLMALSSFICFNKIFKNANYFYKVIFSIMYAFSGYVFINYSNIQWLDNLILFPFLVLSLKHLFDTGKTLPYIIVLTISLIFTFYISYMFLLFIVFSSFIALIFYAKKEDRKKICLKLFFSTLIALGISAFSFLPGYLQSSNSHRIASISTSSSGNPYLFSKLIFYLCSSMSLYFFVNMFVNCKKDKIAQMLTLIFLVTSIGVIIEPINKMWHTGSYVMFPYRYGFIPLFVLLMGGLYYLNNKNEKANFKINKDDIIKNIKYIIAFVIFLIITLLFSNFISVDIRKTMVSIELVTKGLYFKLLILYFLFMVMLMISNEVKNKLIKYIMFGIILFTEIITYGTYYIGFDNYKNSPELNNTDVLVKNAFKIKDDFNNIIDTPYLYKDMTATMTDNYPLITQTRALSNWFHIIKTEQLYNHRDLGYSYFYTRMHDIGGTLFSDMFYGVKYVFSYEKLDNKIYELLETHNEINLYENKYTKSLIKYNENKKIEFKEKDAFYNQNQLYKLFYNKKENIIDIYNIKDLEYTDSNNTITFNIPVQEKSNLYLYFKNENYAAISSILVNNNKINLHSSYENDYYPNFGNNGIIDLGNYENNVIVEIKYIGKIDDLQIGILENDKLINLYGNMEDTGTFKIDKNKIDIKFNSDKNGYIFIPINYNDGFRATVNGKKTNIEKYLNTYMNIPIVKGENNIVIDFEPPYLKIGIKISLICLILLILTILINKKFKIENNRFILYIGLILYGILFIGLFFVINIKCLL